MKVKEYIDYWYYTYIFVNQSPSTAAVNQSHINVHIKPSKLGDMEISQVTMRDAQEFLTELLIHGNKCKIHSINSYGKPLSHWTVRKIRQILIKAFAFAVKENIISTNPILDTVPIVIQPSTVHPFTLEEQRRFLKITHKHRFYVAYELYFFCGCRRGEILGLSWDNVHFSKDYIYISQTLVMEGTTPVLKPRGKTKNAFRTIPIPDEIKRDLHAVKRRQIAEREENDNWNNPHNLVFTQKDGSPVNPASFSRNFKQLLKRHGFPTDLHLHCTRHSWATNMVQLGIPLSDIQAMGGWSRPDILLQIYSQSVKKSHKKAIRKLYKACTT